MHVLIWPDPLFVKRALLFAVDKSGLSQFKSPDDEVQDRSPCIWPPNHVPSFGDSSATQKSLPTLTDVSLRWHPRFSVAVWFILRHQRRRDLSFVTRNSELSKGLRRAFGLESVESMLWIKGDQVFAESGTVMRAA